MMTIDENHGRIMTGLYCWEAARTLSDALVKVDNVNKKMTAWCSMGSVNSWCPMPLGIGATGEFWIYIRYDCPFGSEESKKAVFQQIESVIDEAEQLSLPSEAYLKLKRSLVIGDTDWNAPLNAIEQSAFQICYDRNEVLWRRWRDPYDSFDPSIDYPTLRAELIGRMKQILMRNRNGLERLMA